jgi:hypothetical protein
MKKETHLGPGSLSGDALVLQIGVSHVDHLLPLVFLKCRRVFLSSA